MTSKNLFFKLSLENLKRRLWTIVLIAISFFVTGPLAFVMQLQNWIYELARGNNTREQVLMFVNSYFSFNSMMLIILVICAVFLAIHGFGYLFSKKEVDLYHSIPVKRSKLFAVNYLNGVLIYSFILIIKNLLCSIIAVGYGYYSTTILINMLVSMLIEISGFVLIYSTAVLAVMLTGNFVVALLGTGVLMSYGSIIYFIWAMFAEKFFKTSVYTSLYDSWGDSLVSPIAAVINVIARNVISYSQPIEVCNAATALKDMAILLIPAIVIALLSLFLYNKRPSEASSKAIAFKVTKKPLELLICIPLSMCGGLFLSEFSYNEQNIWLYLGTVISGLLVYLVMETIYEFDIKAAFKLKIMPLLISVISCIVILTFEFDVFGYDTYLPNPDNVEYSGVIISGLDENFERYSDNDGKIMYYGTDEYIRENMEITNTESVVNIAKTGIESLNTSENEISYNRFNVEIYYRMKSGKTIARSYWIDFCEENYNLINEVYKLDEYKKCTSPVYFVDTDSVSSLEWDTGFIYPDEIKFTKEQVKDLIEIYKEELNGLDFNKARNALPLGAINVVVGNRETFETTYSLRVYSSFENTIKYLERMGVDIKKRYDINDIERIVIESYSDYNDMDVLEINAEEAVEEEFIKEGIDYREDTSKIITDKEEMEKILPDLVCDELLYYKPFYDCINQKYCITVSFTDGNMRQYCYTGNLTLI